MTDQRAAPTRETTALVAIAGHGFLSASHTSPEQLAHVLDWMVNTARAALAEQPLPPLTDGPRPAPTSATMDPPWLSDARGQLRAHIDGLDDGLSKSQCTELLADRDRLAAEVARLVSMTTTLASGYRRCVAICGHGDRCSRLAVPDRSPCLCGNHHRQHRRGAAYS